MGRLKPGVTLAQANADMPAVDGAAWREPVPALEHGLERKRRAAEEQLPQRRTRSRRCGCCSAPSVSCCSSPARTSRTCCWRGAPRGSASWPSARRSAHRRGTAVAAVPDRESGPGDGRRRARRGRSRTLLLSRHRGDDARRTRCRPRRTFGSTSRCCSSRWRRVDALRRAVRLRAGLAGRAAEHQRRRSRKPAVSVGSGGRHRLRRALVVVGIRAGADAPRRWRPGDRTACSS